MIRNKFICFVCGWSIHPKKKMTETWHHALRAMMQFPVIFIRMDTSIHKQKNKFIP
jgi:hypothetical protein